MCTEEPFERYPKPKMSCKRMKLFQLIVRRVYHADSPSGRTHRQIPRTEMIVTWSVARVQTRQDKIVSCYKTFSTGKRA